MPENCYRPKPVTGELTVSNKKKNKTLWLRYIMHCLSRIKPQFISIMEDRTTCVVF